MYLTVAEAIDKLKTLFPLVSRRRALPVALQAAHYAIVQAIIRQGEILCGDALQHCLQMDNWADAVHTLADNDLIVLNDAQQVTAAYPLSAEPTPHRIEFDGRQRYALCALDALSIGPLFETRVQIDSRCHLSGQAISILQDGHALLEVQPLEDVRLGIRWQSARDCAARSLCRELVFLPDAASALRWQHSDIAAISLFTLEQGIHMGADFFSGILD